MAYLDPRAAEQAAGGDSAGDSDSSGDSDTAGDGGRLAIDVRGKPEPARVTPLPFYHRPR
jgi:hypothetical protein